MLVEISAVVGVLKTLNAGIKTVKESGSHIQHKSLMEHKHKLEKQRLAKLRKQTKATEAVKTILGTSLLIVVGIALYFLITGGQ